MGSRKDYLINELVKVCQKLDTKGFGANHDGNVSCKFDEYLLATPTAESKGNINHEMIITLDMEGKKIEGIGNPFSEIKLHLAAYNSREEIGAVVHAHPPFAMARGLAEAVLEINIPEAIVSIGDEIPVTKFSMPGTKESEELVVSALQETDAFMMPGNGVWAVGENLELAYLRLELVEHVAKIDYYARGTAKFASPLGRPVMMDESNVNKLLEKRASIGLGPKNIKKAERKSEIKEADPLRELIAEEIRKILKES